MQARYRFHGKFISKQKASRLGRITKNREFLSTDITEKKGGKTFVSSQGYLGDVAAKTVYAMEKDRRSREDMRVRRRDRERERTIEFQRKQVSPEYYGGEPPQQYDYPDYGGGSSYSFPADEDEEEQDYLPGSQPIENEDELIDDYFEDGIEVADIDGDIYVEQ